MAERQLPKLHTGVRFPSPALFTYDNWVCFAVKKWVVRTTDQNTATEVHRCFTTVGDLSSLLPFTGHFRCAAIRSAVVSRAKRDQQRNAPQPVTCCDSR